MMATRMRSKPIPHEVHVRRTTSSTAVYASTAVDGDSEISSMKVGEIKKELESYGISTVSFVEKSQLVEALKKARADDLKPEPKKTKKNWKVMEFRLCHSWKNHNWSRP